MRITCLLITMFFFSTFVYAQENLEFRFSGFADTYHAVRSQSPFDFMSSRSRLRVELAASKSSSYLFASLNAVYNSMSTPFLLFEDQLSGVSDVAFMLTGLIALPVATYSLWLFLHMAPPFQPPEREPLKPGHLSAILVTAMMVLGMFAIMILLELWVRLNPDLAGV